MDGEAPRQTAVTAAEVLRLVEGERPNRFSDTVAVEEPLEVRLGGKPATVIMRTPSPAGDAELARGFLFTEGLITSADDIAEIRRPEGLKPEEVGNVVDVTLAPRLVQLRPRSVERNFYATSSCGVCGKASLQAIEVHAARVTSDLRVARAVLLELPERLRMAQAAFDLTGGLHAAALFDAAGTLLALREDVGRHNAVDKLVGWALQAGHVPASRLVLMVSGRTSFEILQKAAMAGIPLLCAVSAPSSLAISLADRMGITLVGFLRGQSMNVYAHPGRIEHA
ncbi:MAG TPA: formate dehydrogenase accessory sulfurtransferase FdhD [Polyangia bacterium]|jgi:FdhD protein|nr:formate dehydrogenase accessory sulfurtransferase FdhD [Polyangia bacterium]